MIEAWEVDHEVSHIERRLNRIRCANCGAAADAKDWMGFMRRHKGCPEGPMPEAEPRKPDPWPSDATCDAVAEAVENITFGLFGQHLLVYGSPERIAAQRAAIREALAKGEGGQR